MTYTHIIEKKEIEAIAEDQGLIVPSLILLDSRDSSIKAEGPAVSGGRANLSSISIVTSGGKLSAKYLESLRLPARRISRLQNCQPARSALA